LLSRPVRTLNAMWRLATASSWVSLRLHATASWVLAWMRRKCHPRRWSAIVPSLKTMESSISARRFSLPPLLCDRGVRPSHAARTGPREIHCIGDRCFDGARSDPSDASDGVQTLARHIRKIGTYLKRKIVGGSRRHGTGLWKGAVTDRPRKQAGRSMSLRGCLRCRLSNRRRLKATVKNQKGRSKLLRWSLANSPTLFGSFAPAQFHNACSSQNEHPHCSRPHDRCCDPAQDYDRLGCGKVAHQRFARCQ